MRRFFPWITLFAIAVLVTGTVVISLRVSGRVSFFSEPPPANPQVLKQFDADVEATLQAPSFTFRSDALGGIIEYQAPNRAAYIINSPPLQFADFAIGDSAYLELSCSGPAMTTIPANGTLSPSEAAKVLKGANCKWGLGRLTASMDSFQGPVRVKDELRDLLKLQSVSRSGTTFFAQQVVPANLVSPGNAGQALLRFTITTSRGFVVAERSTAYGQLSTYLLRKGKPPTAISTSRITLESVSYSNIGSVLRITPPPRSKTVKLVPCRNPNAVVFGAKYVCGLDGT